MCCAKHSLAPCLWYGTDPGLPDQPVAVWTVAPAECPTPILYKVEGIREQARALHIVSVWRGGLANADFLALGSWEKQWKVSVPLTEFWGTGKRCPVSHCCPQQHEFPPQGFRDLNWGQTRIGGLKKSFRTSRWIYEANVEVFIKISLVYSEA